MLIGLFFLYFIGNNYYKLALACNRSGWGYAILGVATYYAGGILGAFMIGIYIEVNTDSSIDDFPETVLNLISIPFGIVACWGTYRFLKKRWSNPQEVSDPTDVLDGDLKQPEQNGF